MNTKRSQKLTDGVTDFAKRLEYFLHMYLPFERNLSSKTVKSYRDAFVKFLLYMDKTHHVRPEKFSLKHLTRENVQGFIDSLHREGCKPSTCNHRLAVIWAFVKYLQYEDVSRLAQWQQILAIHKLKEDEPVVEYLTAEAIAAILNKPNRSIKNGRRHYLILAMLYDLGLRVQELADLKVKDVRIYNNEVNVYVMGKGRKERLVPMMGESVETVRDYLKEWQLTEVTKSDHPLFFNARGTKLTRSGITHILKLYADMARATAPDAIPENISCHKLRHSKAMHLLQNGVNLIYIRDLLGHSSEKTTEIYARVGSSFKDEALRKAYEGTTVQTGTQPRWKEEPSLLKRLMEL